MKRAIYSVLTLVVLIGLTGCINHNGRRPLACMGGSCDQAPESCQSCQATDATCGVKGGATCDDNSVDPGRKHHCRFFNGGLFKERGEQEVVSEAPEAGPQTGAVAYPYYTTRGPRDFLAKNPGSIGP